MTWGMRAGCPHDDLHDDPDTKPWGVFVAAERDLDRQPIYLRVQPSNGAHVADSDAEWLWTVIRERGRAGMSLYFDQIRPVAQCRCGARCFGTSVNDAVLAWAKHLTHDCTLRFEILT